MPPRGWKKGPDGQYYKSGEPKTVKIGPPANVAQPDKVPENRSQVNRLEELLRCLPDAPFVQMASSSGMPVQEIRELVDLFRKLKA